MNSILEKIRNLDDLKNIDRNELPQLANEIRERIVDVLSKNGGHLSSNLGVVELTIALHRVFHSPSDAIIWDVGHQCYTHKILTGRNDVLDTIRQKDGISGFPKRSESKHDFFETGHASTSISAALGILEGKRKNGDNGKVIAVIGDGALTGGMVYEAMNHAGHLQKDLIIVLNDNNMSISRNVGALSSSNTRFGSLSSYVSKMTATPLYQSFRDKVDRGMKHIPLLGMRLFKSVVKLKRSVKALLLKENIFSDLGFEYVGPIDGHSFKDLEKVFCNVKKMHKPVVVHVVTHKGYGYSHALDDPTKFHGISPFSVNDGRTVKQSCVTYSQILGDTLCRLALQDNRVFAITAAMVTGTGLAGFEKKFPERLYDVGIAEQHALTFASGMAAQGLRPFVAIYSTFMQRGVDQLIHDIALQKLPVTICMDRAGVVPSDGETHQGVFDIALFFSIPEICFLAPGTKDELEWALEYSLSVQEPVLIRYPKDCALLEGFDGEKPQKGKGLYYRQNQSKTLLVSCGAMLNEALEAEALLLEEKNPVDVYNLLFLKPMDERYFKNLTSNYDTIIFIEEGSVIGSVSAYLALQLKENFPEKTVHIKAIRDAFYSQASRQELLCLHGLDAKSIRDFVLKKNLI